jgi:hypothetical protein
LALLFKHAEIFPQVNNLTDGQIRKLGQDEKYEVQGQIMKINFMTASQRSAEKIRKSLNKEHHDGTTNKVLKR